MGDCSGDFLSFLDLDIICFVWFFSYAQCFVNQIEVPVGREKTPVLIKKLKAWTR
jgi:hypothetical protein